MKIKKRVDLSTYSFVVSIVGIVFLAALAYFQYGKGNIESAIFILVALCVLCICTLIYAPMSVEVDNDKLSVNRPLWIKNIKLNDIKSISLVQPTMAERRIIGSGGWCGYWGWFREPTIGKYFAYYGKASDCFLVEQKNGRKYLIGCRQPEEIVEFVKTKI